LILKTYSASDGELSEAIFSFVVRVIFKNMKKSFLRLWNEGNNGFIALPILIIAIIGTLAIGGGGYGVYKYNQLADQKAQAELKLSELKDNEIKRLQEQVELKNTNTGTTSNDAITEVSVEPVVKKLESIDQTTKNEAISDASAVKQKADEQAKIDEGVQNALKHQLENSKTAFAKQLSAIHLSVNKEGYDYFLGSVKDNYEGNNDRSLNKLNASIAICKDAIANSKNLRVFFTNLPVEYINASINMENAANNLCHSGVGLTLEDQVMMRNDAIEMDRNLNLVADFLTSISK
jgi:hypothetical protein